MNIIIGERCSGKTTELIKRSAAEHLYILVATKTRAGDLFKMARELGYAIPFPVTVEEYFKGSKFQGSCIRRDGLLIDDADDVLQWIFQGIPIKGITMTGDYDNLTVLLHTEED